MPKKWRNNKTIDVIDFCKDYVSKDMLIRTIITESEHIEFAKTQAYLALHSIICDFCAQAQPIILFTETIEH